jgi:hypothetical protein
LSPKARPVPLGPLTPKAWPVPLGRLSPALARALEMPAEFSEWPEGKKVLSAPQPLAIGNVLVEANHPLLVTRAVAYLWVKGELGTGGKRTTLGKARVASAKIRHFGHVDFVIDFNWTAWQTLSAVQRVALVDHELAHCATDGDTLKPLIIDHDVEEFGVILERWGLWTPELVAFGESVKRAFQLSLELGD